MLQHSITIPFTDYIFHPAAKTCVNCNCTKPLQHFYKEKSSTDGRRKNCKQCKRTKDTAYQNAKYLRDPEYREYKKKNSKKQYAMLTMEQ